MKNIYISTLIAFCIALASGCSTWESMGSTGRGAVTGGAIGSGLGAIVGNQTGSPGAGVAIGGAAGALSGGLIGRAMDKNDSGYERARPSQCPTDSYYDYDRNVCLPRCGAGQYYDSTRGACFSTSDRYSY